MDYSQSPALLRSGSFTTPPGTAVFRVGLAASVDNDVADGWLFFDRVSLTALSQPIPIVPGQSLDIAANIQGVLDGSTGQTSGQLAAHFYDHQGNLLAVDPIWQATDYHQPTAPQTHSGTAVHATATQMRVGLTAVLDEGWLAFDTIRLTSLSALITARPEQYHQLAAQVSGQLNSAGDGRLFVQYSNGTIHDVWQNDDVFNGSQNITGNFTTPANISSFQVGTEVVLDNGNLAFDDLTLTAYSDRVIAVPLTDYRLTAQITGELNVDQGQGGKVWAVYENLAGQPLGSALLWPNPANFSGTAVMQAVFTPVPLTDKIRIALETNLDAGYLTFDNLELENLPTTGPIIQRSTYSVAGQPIAVKVSGDPDGNNGLFFLYSDHPSTGSGQVWAAPTPCSTRTAA